MAAPILCAPGILWFFLQEKTSMLAKRPAPYRSLLGPSGPKCPGECPRECWAAAEGGAKRIA